MRWSVSGIEGGVDVGVVADTVRVGVTQHGHSAAQIYPQKAAAADGVTSTPYFFDSGYAYYTNKADAKTWSSAITMNKNDHTITLNADAQGVAQFQSEYTAAGQNPSSWFPFLPTSGNNPAGESNTPYYCHGGAFGRKDIGTTYKNRDFHYALSGEGYFAYEPNLYFNFQGDDDVYVYINGQLVIDIGGTHGATSYSMYLDDYVDWAKGVKYNGETYKGKTYANLSEADQRRVDALCLVTGGVYSFDFFYMERHGVGSNLRIMTNMKIVESSLDVEKHAWQNGVKLMDNGLFDANEIVEYGFSITNNSEGKLYNLSFVDETIGIQMDSENGLTVTGNLTDALGAKLSPAGLVITVDGFDENGNQLDTVNVSCPNNDALIRFLQDLSAEGTQDGDAGDDYAQLYSGSGLWKDATVTVRGIHYRLTEQQKKINSFKNTVTGVAFMKTAGLGGGIEDRVLWGADVNTLYQPGRPAYYQWAGRPIVIESEMLYEDLIAGHVVSSADELPDPRDMILIPSNAAGTEALNSNVSNVPGGDVYLKVNYETPGSYMAHVTIRDAKDDNYSITVPITVYALGTQNSSVVLDYGLDSYLTDYDALFKYEMASAAKDDLTGSVLAIGDDTANPSYREYNQDKQVELAAGQINNDLKLVSGTYTYNRTEQADKTVLETAKLSSGIYELEKPIFLDHNKPWVIEWRGKFDNTLLFSTMKKSAEGNTYIYCASGRNGLYIGEHAQEHFKVTSTGTTVSYNNYGLQNSALDSGVVKTYAMVNRPDGAGGNTVYLYVDGTQIGAMNQYHYQNTAWPKDNNNKATNDSWLSGRDFTFNYMGTVSHPLNSEYEFIRVYEDGYHLTHFNWQMPDGKAAGDKVINSVSTGETGYVSNAATWKEYTVASSGNHKNYWSLNQPVTLAHDENWELTFTAEQINVGTVLMSAQDSSKTNATHIYLYPGGNHQMVHMGFELPDEIGSHTNYGVNICDVIPGFSMTDKHTYVLRNMVQPSGGNMVHLYVDGTYIGPLDSKYWGSADIVEEVTDEISGLDFTFHYLSADANLQFGYMDDLKLHKLEVRTRPVLSNSYEWVPGGGGLISTVATDPTGNQIVFTADADGIVEAEDGQFTLDSKGLKFAVEDMMDGRYTAYVALAIHDRDFAPTALNVDGIDIRHEVQMYKQVTVLPANVVYYEDDFPAIHYYGTAVNSFAALGNVSTDYADYSDTKYYAEGSSSGMTQSPDQDIPYGSDGVYQNIFSNSSGSTMHTIAINNDGPLAWFGFKGTGFELDARTSATQAGMIYVEVYKKGEVTLDAKGNPVVGDDGFIAGTPIEIVPVIPQFDIGTMIENRFEMENGGSEAIYQVPIIQYSDLEYGDYIIVISGVETLDYDDNMAHKDTYLYLDGIRIYNPLGTAAVPEYGDEQKVIFEEIRDGIVDGHILVGDYDESKGLEVGTGLMTWTEKYDNRAHTGEWGYVGNAVTDVNDYLMDGPNNEVYLDGTFTNGALVFYVRQTRGADNILQLGVRALDAGLYYGAGSTGMRANLMLGVMGTTASGTTEPGWHYICTVASGTEQYYSIPYTLAPVVTIDGNLYHQVVIKVDAYSTAIPAMVSFTNIKRSEGLAVCESQFIAADQVDAEGNPIVAGEIQGYQLLSRLTTQMSAYRNFTINEAEPGSDFAVETPEVPDANAPVIVPGYPTLAFEGEVRYNIYFNVENMEGIAAGNLGLITFHTPNSEGTVADAVDVIPGALWSGTHYMVHTNGIAAKNLGDTLYFKVYAKLADGSYVYSSLLSYSALNYAENRLTKSDDPQLKSLVVAMLNYGAAAQQFFGYRTDALMNAGLTAEQLALAAPYRGDMAAPVVPVDSAKVGAFASTGGFKGGYASVSFTGAFMLNYYFTPDKAVSGPVTMYYWDAETYNGVDTLTAENATGKQIMTGSGEYVGTVTGMAAKEIGETVYVAVVYESSGTAYCSGVVAYSIDSYCARHAGNEASDMQELAAATTVYGYYAKNYFAN